MLERSADIVGTRSRRADRRRAVPSAATAESRGDVRTTPCRTRLETPLRSDRFPATTRGARSGSWAECSKSGGLVGHVGAGQTVMGVSVIRVDVHHEGVFDEDRRTTVRDNDGLTRCSSLLSSKVEARDAYVALSPSCIATLGFVDHST
jgi:hypothetical protein